MPHILADDWEPIAHTHEDNYHQIETNIANEMYEGKRLEDAQACLAATATLWVDINQEHRGTAESLTAQQETFL